MGIRLPRVPDDFRSVGSPVGFRSGSGGALPDRTPPSDEPEVVPERLRSVRLRHAKARPTRASWVEVVAILAAAAGFGVLLLRVVS